MAERIVDLIGKKIESTEQRGFKAVETESIHLVGGPFYSPKELSAYTLVLSERLEKLELKNHWPSYLLENYGRQCDVILDKMSSFENEKPEIALIRAEAWFAVHFEMCFSLVDFFTRRTGRLYFDLPRIEKLTEATANDFSNHLQWDETEKENQKKALQAVLVGAVAFKK